MKKAAAIVIPAGLVLGTALWAFAPLETPVVDTGGAGEALSDPKVDPSIMATVAVGALDRSAFHTPLWIAPVSPAPPPAPAPPPTAPPPLRLQLLAIIQEEIKGGAEGGKPVYRAMVYDPDSDHVLVVAAGESLGSRTVESIDQTALRIKDGHGVRVLTLKVDGGPNR